MTHFEVLGFGLEGYKSLALKPASPRKCPALGRGH